jgi:lysophospholipase L1-like esterase
VKSRIYFALYAVIAVTLSLYLTGCARSSTPEGSTDFSDIGTTTPESKRVSVYEIGDSISKQYGGHCVRNLLPKTFDVAHIPDNARSTTYTLAHLDEWFTDDKHYDVITWNNGLWDLLVNDTYNFSTPEQYRANLREIGTYLKLRADHVVFFTTTDIPVNYIGRVPGSEIERNDIAREVMNELDIPIYDLWAVSETILDLHLNADTQTNVHYTEAGAQVLAKTVAQAIMKQLQ